MLKGIIYSLIASLLFSFLYYLSVLLRPLSGESIFGFRMWVTIPFILSAIFIFKQKKEFIEFIKLIFAKPKLILVLCTTSFLMGVQMWLFLWSPNNGKAIDVSIGYLLMPIMMVAFGRIFFKEKLSKLKLLAIIFASLGVLNNLISYGSISWATLLVLIGYPVYFGLRKHFNIVHISSFVCEFILLLPVAAYFIYHTEMNVVLAENPNLPFLLFLLGLVSGMALILYVMASTLVPMNVLGLLGYVEPTAMLAVSFMIGETLDDSSYFLLFCLTIAIALLIFEGLYALRKQKRTAF